jgi:acetoin utilization deacetylase AcuC-like enzyme
MRLINHAEFAARGKLDYPRPEFETYECPERIVYLQQHLRTAGLWDSPRVTRVAAEPASISDIRRVHSGYLVRQVQMLSDFGGGQLGSLVQATPDTLELALLSAGAAITGVQGFLDAGISGEDRPFFSLNRPPGHHASRGHSEGLCVFNNVAVAVAWLRAQGFSRRIMIVDLDAHYGNGTAALFDEDPSVFYFGVHEYDFPLGSETGSCTDLGGEAGRCTTFNFPVPVGSCDDAFLMTPSGT